MNGLVNSFEEVFEAVKEYCTKDGKVGDIAKNLWLDTLKPARLEGTDAVFYCSSDFQRSVVNNNYAHLLQEGFEQILGFPVQLRLIVQDSGKDFQRLLKYCRENKYDYKDILEAVRQIRMRGVRRINFEQIKVALETRDTAPLTFTDSQRTDAFLEIELGSEDVLAQLDGIMQGNAGATDMGRRCAP